MRDWFSRTIHGHPFNHTSMYICSPLWTFVHLLTLLYDTFAIVLRAGFMENGGRVGVLVGWIIYLRVKDEQSVSGGEA